MLGGLNALLFIDTLLVTTAAGVAGVVGVVGEVGVVAFVSLPPPQAAASRSPKSIEAWRIGIGIERVEGGELNRRESSTPTAFRRSHCRNLQRSFRRGALYRW